MLIKTYLLYNIRCNTIDGRGNVLLQTDNTEERVIKLSDVLVIATGDRSENVLLLKKLADAKFSIYLDDSLLRVYRRVRNKSILEGKYGKPNCVIRFEVKRNNNESTKDIEHILYSCKARIISHK